jgi:hypothetical protein
MGDQKFIVHASECTLRRCSRLHLQSLAPSPFWAYVVVYGQFSLCDLHKEGLCPRSGDINRLDDDDDDDDFIEINFLHAVRSNTVSFVVGTTVTETRYYIKCVSNFRLKNQLTKQKATIICLKSIWNFVKVSIYFFNFLLFMETLL